MYVMASNAKDNPIQKLINRTISARASAALQRAFVRYEYARMQKTTGIAMKMLSHITTSLMKYVANPTTVAIK